MPWGECGGWSRQYLVFCSVSKSAFTISYRPNFREPVSTSYIDNTIEARLNMCFWLLWLFHFSISLSVLSSKNKLFFTRGLGQLLLNLMPSTPKPVVFSPNKSNYVLSGGNGEHGLSWRMERVEFWKRRGRGLERQTFNHCGSSALQTIPHLGKGKFSN